MISAFHYTNYREYLRDRFNSEKRKGRGFSYRSFNRKAGISSSSFLKLVMDGKRNLSPDGVLKVARAFNLPDDETDFFFDLVCFNQSKKFDEKDLYFKKILQHRYKNQIQIIDPEHDFLFSQWYYLPILELVRFSSRRGQKKDDHWFLKYLRPHVSLHQVRDALALLCQKGFLKKSAYGYKRRNFFLTTSDEVYSHSVLHFYRDYCDRAKMSVSEDSEKTRDFSTLTIAVSRRGFEMAKQEIRKFRKRLHTLLESKGLGEKETVAHVNLQLFQICRLEEKE